MPPWLTRPLSNPERTRAVRTAIAERGLCTVCQEARCPNRAECWSRGTATFMILGDRCTRDCAFCAIAHGAPRPVDPAEPVRIADAAASLGLRYVVVTSVTRDDLADGGAAQFASTIAAVREGIPAAEVEVLVPDFGGRAAPIGRVLDAGPLVFGHNVETVERLYPSVRSGAGYRRSLAVLEGAAATPGRHRVKSAIMVGLGETRGELHAALADLAAAGVRIGCVGQYLRPSPAHRPVERFVSPEEFEDVREFALSIGFELFFAGPFVRSSYRAESAAAHAGL
jgi:lipoic acid synthetase